MNEARRDLARHEAAVGARELQSSDEDDDDDGDPCAASRLFRGPQHKTVPV